jgi:imidazolonepropionase-like amidohydrolase
MIEELARHRVVVDPTLMAMHTKFWGDDPLYTNDPDLALVSEELRQSWQAGRFTQDWTAEQYAQAQRSWPVLLGLIKAMHDGGVHLVAGTDTPTPWIIPGVSMHDELKLLVDAGIPPLEVIRIATHNAAVALRRGHEFGTVRPDRRADLIVLDKNPLDDITNTRAIRLVLQRGEIVHRSSAP